MANFAQKSILLAFLRACNACKRGAPIEFERHGGETVQSSSQHEIKLSTIMSPFCSFGYAFDDRISSYLRPRPYRPFPCRYSLGSIRMQIRDALRSDSEEQSTLCVAPWPIDNLAAFSDVRKPRFGFFVKPFRASFAFRMPPPPPPPPPPPRTTPSPLYLMSDKISAV